MRRIAASDPGAAHRSASSSYRRACSTSHRLSSERDRREEVFHHHGQWLDVRSRVTVALTDAAAGSFTKVSSGHGTTLIEPHGESTVTVEFAPIDSGQADYRATSSAINSGCDRAANRRRKSNRLALQIEKTPTPSPITSDNRDARQPPRLRSQRDSVRPRPVILTATTDAQQPQSDCSQGRKLRTNLHRLRDCRVKVGTCRPPLTATRTATCDCDCVSHCDAGGNSHCDCYGDIQLPPRPTLPPRGTVEPGKLVVADDGKTDVTNTDRQRRPPSATATQRDGTATQTATASATPTSTLTATATRTATATATRDGDRHGNRDSNGDDNRDRDGYRNSDSHRDGQPTRRDINCDRDHHADGYRNFDSRCADRRADLSQ